jgi:hypothetical protein
LLAGGEERIYTAMMPQFHIPAVRKVRCTVCRSHQLEEVMSLPQLPLTGVYVDSHDQDRKYPLTDQAFRLCRECGHGQLEYALDPKYIYEDTYTHRGSCSPIASGGNEFFAEYLDRLIVRRPFRHIVDIGCSDLYLLRLIKDKAAHATGIDPIWRSRDHRRPDGITVLGRFVEEIDWEKDLDEAPDLVVSAHTFEHVNEAGEELRRTVKVASDNALFVIEVPSLDSLLNVLRFDQIFHQHINYYSLASMLRLIQELDCTYIDHTYNYNFWSGTMLVAFRKGATADYDLPGHKTHAPDFVLERLRLFREQIETLNRLLPTVSEPVYGYGGAQMTPILAYHMKSDFSFLECILDDNPARHGKSYPHMPVVIQLPAPGFTLKESAVLVTALDSLRPIFRRTVDLEARHIILPLHNV